MSAAGDTPTPHEEELAWHASGESADLFKCSSFCGQSQKQVTAAHRRVRACTSATNASNCATTSSKSGWPNPRPAWSPTSTCRSRARSSGFLEEVRRRSARREACALGRRLPQPLRRVRAPRHDLQSASGRAGIVAYCARRCWCRLASLPLIQSARAAGRRGRDRQEQHPAPGSHRVRQEPIWRRRLRSG